METPHNAEQENPLQQQISSKSKSKRRAIILGVALFLLVIAAMFLFVYFNSKEAKQSTPPEEEYVDERYSSITRVDGKHYYIDGVHTVVGEVAMPTPCDLLQSDAVVAESYPEQITLDFTVRNNADFCAQVITPQRFKVSAPASEQATFSARFEGRPIELNLVEAAEGESPDEFELFIKG